jgi:hypothetical protein
MSWHRQAEATIRVLRSMIIEETGTDPLTDALEEGETAEELFRDHYDSFYEGVWEAAMQIACPVFSLDWDSGAPGAGAGTESVYEFAGKYFGLSSEGLWDGPYESLEDCWGRIHVSGATTAISCWEWSEEEIIDRLEFFGAPAGLNINGTDWPFEHLEREYERRTGKQVRE